MYTRGHMHGWPHAPWCMHRRPPGRACGRPCMYTRGHMHGWPHARSRHPVRAASPHSRACAHAGSPASRVRLQGCAAAGLVARAGKRPRTEARPRVGKRECVWRSMATCGEATGHAGPCREERTACAVSAVHTDCIVITEGDELASRRIFSAAVHCHWLPAESCTIGSRSAKDRVSVCMAPIACIH